MLKKYLSYILIPLFLFLFACSDENESANVNYIGGTDEATVGTIVSTPGVDDDTTVGTIVSTTGLLVKYIFPKFDDTITTASLNDQSSTETPTAEETPTQEGQSQEGDDEEEKHVNLKSDLTPDHVPIVWEMIFLEGGIQESQEILKKLQRFGLNVKDAMARDGITEITEEGSKFVLDGKILLMGNSYLVKIEMKADKVNDGFINAFFYDRKTNFLFAKYSFAVDEAGYPNKGIFAAYNSKRETAEDLKAKRVIALAYDFSYPTDSKLVMRVDRYHRIFDYNTAYQVYFQCNSELSTCIGEYQSIQTKPPLREFSDLLYRFAWNEVTNNVCLADINYGGPTGGNPAELSNFASFKGAVKPKSSQVTMMDCQIPTPIWGDHAFSPDDLILRHYDTFPVGGYGVALFGDGINYEGWNRYVQPELIPGWHSGARYE